MSIEIKVPDIGGDEVEVTEILVAVGDVVEVDQALLTVEGDKASMEVPADTAGTVKEIKVSVGDNVATGSLVFIFEGESEGESADKSASADKSDSAAEQKTPATDAKPAPAASGSTAQDVTLPDIGDDEVEVTEILVAVGDSVSEDQSILSVEGDKASMEVPAPFAGTVKEIKVATGDTVKTGSLVFVFEVAGSESAAPAAESTPAETKAAPAAEQSSVSSTKEVNVPDIGGDEVEVTEVLVAVGDSVTEDQSLLNVEGDKAAMELPAPFAGTVKEIKVATGDKVSTGSLIFVFEVAGGAPAAAAKPEAEKSAPAAKSEKPAPKAETATQSAPAASNESFADNSAYAHASPVVRRLAREFGINLANVKGSGRKNRVVKDDVQNYVKNLVKQVESGQLSADKGNAGGSELGLIPWPKVDFAKFGEIEEKKLSRIQKLSGKNLHRNWVQIPHVTQFDEADITSLEEFRKEQNALNEKKKLGVKITPLVFVMKAAAKALAEFPTINSSLSNDGESLILKKYINIGVAVDTPNGLVVPVFKDVDKKGIIELSRELMEVSAKARDGKLTSADMQGGCFTISSLGGIGGTAFTPIVNAPEVAILGVSKSEMKPKWNGKEFEPKLMVPLSMSYDHRVIDGALAARFTVTLASYMSDIRQLVM
ncbi:pyruvate dehydrogenase complex dihydrolipoyllysine-residue acetyltransferase [Pseudoalteromonas translucida]|uniref:Acetyltransferase component of pyruvate dehydrogenase complex n=1 Tax=Pseudoalteromonas translucida (strain TAC 125) TaxID=326442 RepID=Q3IIH7_PSET1|nr:pyruvate dehydrogenase complex dihydrolipoyllysine-residue acetyltransferase [Pseudoalteromonas translucida]CAI85490.1 pyruvate dehydrogenase, dihydrolipoyltransacetylase subunit [Pseudoalteromonas translucida]